MKFSESVKLSEVLRYLGYGRNMGDERTLVYIAESLMEIEKETKPKEVHASFPLTAGDGEVSFAGINIKSAALARNLKGCDEVIVFAATLGAEADRLLKKYLALDMPKAVVFQATAAACIEEYCDDLNRNLKAEAEAKGRYLRPRFSPGYGDFALTYQNEILGLIEAHKYAGITLTDGGIMVPEKSVSALIGVSNENTACAPSGCEACGNKECGFRRNTV